MLGVGKWLGVRPVEVDCLFFYKFPDCRVWMDCQNMGFLGFELDTFNVCPITDWKTWFWAIECSFSMLGCVDATDASSA